MSRKSKAPHDPRCQSGPSGKFIVCHSECVYVPPERRAAKRFHEDCWVVCRRLPTDFEPWGTRNRDDDPVFNDCSCGCKHFQARSELVGDWGICLNPQSPRAGLLTFEHQGCPEYEHEGDLA